MAEPWKVVGMLHAMRESVGKSMIVFCPGRLVWSEEGTLLKRNILHAAL